MKQIGAYEFESLGEALAITTGFGFTSYILARDAYYERDPTIAFGAVIGLVGTCIFTYNTVALGLYGDTSNDYTGT